MATFCDKYQKKFPNITLKSDCGWFKSTTKALSHEIEQARIEVRAALQTGETKKRKKRGIINAIGRISKVLFGTCSDEDADLFYSKITEMSRVSSNTLHLVREQTRVVRSIIANINSTLEVVQKTKVRMSQAIQNLYKNLQQNMEKQEILVIRELLNEQSTVLNLLLTQHRLSNIVNSATHGQLHPNLMTHQQYIEQFREIQLKLMHELCLPFTIDKLSIYKLSKIADVSVVFRENVRMFIQKISLLDNYQINVYKVIPFLVYQKNNIYSLLCLQFSS